MCACVCVWQTLSFALAEKEGAKFVLANDPDADRLAAAEKQDGSVPCSVNGSTSGRPVSNVCVSASAVAGECSPVTSWELCWAGGCFTAGSSRTLMPMLLR